MSFFSVELCRKILQRPRRDLAASASGMAHMDIHGEQSSFDCNASQDRWFCSQSRVSQDKKRNSVITTVSGELAVICISVFRTCSAPWWDTCRNQLLFTPDSSASDGFGRELDVCLCCFPELFFFIFLGNQKT